MVSNVTATIPPARSARWRHNRWGDAGEELYDHETDAGEFTNLASDPTYTAQLKELRALLESTRRRAAGGVLVDSVR